jgi:DNA-binding NtrC family response regulator
VITDLKMPGMTGVELLEKIREIDDDLPDVVMTAFGTIQTAVDAMKRGAFDFVTKPFEGDELIITLKRGLGHAGPGARERGAAGREHARAAGGVRAERARSAHRRQPRDARGEGADRGGRVEPGHGADHRRERDGQGGRRAGDPRGEPAGSGPFLAVNCAALSESLLESELFGHERGAFTGADKLRKGRFELRTGARCCSTR